MVHYDTELLLLGFWMVSSEAFFSPYLSRAEKEEIAVNVSRGNQCDYCAAHTNSSDALPWVACPQRCHARLRLEWPRK